MCRLCVKSYEGGFFLVEAADEDRFGVVEDLWKKIKFEHPITAIFGEKYIWIVIHKVYSQPLSIHSNVKTRRFRIFEVSDAA